MTTAKAMRHQNQLLRADGIREGMAVGEQKATEDVLAYLDAQAPPARAIALQFIADIKAGKHLR